VILNRDRKLDAEVTGLLTAAGLEAKRHARAVAMAKCSGRALDRQWPAAGQILDHIIALNEEILHRVMRDYVSYHPDDRLHDSLEKDAPSGRAIEPRPGTNGAVISMPRLGGLHHRYAWRQAA
jgi:hypothetical protein